jgi:hypothetical protein
MRDAAKAEVAIAFDLARDGDHTHVYTTDGQGNLLGEVDLSGVDLDQDTFRVSLRSGPVVEHYRARGAVRRGHQVPENYRDRLNHWIIQPEALLALGQMNVDNTVFHCVCSGWAPGQFSIPAYEHMMVSIRLRLGEVPQPGYLFGLYLEGDIEWQNLTGSEISLDTFAIHHGETGDIAYLRMETPEVIPPGRGMMLQMPENGLLGRVS